MLNFVDRQCPRAAKGSHATRWQSRGMSVKVKVPYGQDWDARNLEDVADRNMNLEACREMEIGGRTVDVVAICLVGTLSSR